MVASGAVVLLSMTTGNQIGLGLIGLATVLFAIVTSMVIPRRRPDFPGRNLGGFLMLCVCVFAAMLFAVFYFGKETHEGTLGEQATATAPAETGETATTTETAETTETTETETAGEGGADLAAGREVFEQNCTSCHTLADAGATGTIGPNLDELAPDQATVEHQVENGGGAMPAFKGTLTPEQIENVSAYVAGVAGNA